MAANFQENSSYFKPWMTRHQRAFRKFRCIFPLTEKSKLFLENKGFSTISISGDTRIDRVIKGQNDKIPDKLFSKFKGDSRLLVLGSCYAQEEQLIEKLIKSYPSIKVIFTPHFVDPKSINRIRKRYPEAAPYSEIKNELEIHYKLLIIDEIGLLSSIYQLADWAFIGGGFKHKGLHNTLEAAVHGIPICFGPKISAFPETDWLLESGQATIVKTPEEIVSWIEKTNAWGLQKEKYQKAFIEKRGLAEQIAKSINSKLNS